MVVQFQSQSRSNSAEIFDGQSPLKILEASTIGQHYLGEMPGEQLRAIAPSWDRQRLLAQYRE
jgi:hypothetical protein